MVRNGSTRHDIVPASLDRIADAVSAAQVPCLVLCFAAVFSQGTLRRPVKPGTCLSAKQLQHVR